MKKDKAAASVEYCRECRRPITASFNIRKEVKLARSSVKSQDAGLCLDCHAQDDAHAGAVARHDR